MAEQYQQLLPVEERRAASTEIRIRIPHPSSTLVNNVLGLVGLVAIIVTVGAKADWIWALGVAGVFAVTLCLIGSTYAPAALPPAELADGEREAPAGPTVAAVPRSA